MKRLLSIFVIISLLLSLASCRFISVDDEFSEASKAAQSGSSSGLTVSQKENEETENNSEIEFLGEISEIEVSYGENEEWEDEENSFDEGREDESFPDDDEQDNEESVPDSSKPEEKPKECTHKNQKTVNEKAASCKELGYTGDKVCSDCGKTIEKGSTIAKANHSNITVENKKEASLKSEGYSGDRVCGVCKTVVEAGKTIAKLTYEQVITPSVLQAIENGFIRLVNEERALCGVAPLTVNAHLDSWAQVRASEIKISFSHTRPNGESCFSIIDSVVYPWSNLGENIGYTSQIGSGYVGPDEVFAPTDEVITKVYTNMFIAFKNSSGHYANIISPDFEHMGLGITYAESHVSGIPYFYFAHFFGSDW